MQQTVEFRTAKRSVERKLGFGLHLAIYLAVNGGLLLLGLLRHDEIVRPALPLLGWGIAVLFHGLAVLLRAPYSDLKRRMIERELGRN
jgi:hypothetical protein